MTRNEFVNESIVREIVQLIRGTKDRARLADLLGDYHDYDVATAMSELEPDERARLYSLLGAERSARIFEFYDEPERYVAELKPRQAAAIVEEMDSDEAVELLKGVDRDYCRALVRCLSRELRGEIRLISSYDEDEIGSLMSTNYICIPRTLSVKQAMRALIRQSAENDNISTIYVVDEEERYYGAVDLKNLILAREHTPLEDIIVTSYPFVHDHDTIDGCMEWIKDYEEDSIPVLDAGSRLIGVVTMQDMLEYTEEESREVYNKLAGIAEGDDREGGGLDEPARVSVRKRLPWLAVLLVLGMFVSSVVGMFEGLVSQIAILVCFQSLILDMAGNVGTQSLAVTIRALIDGDIGMRAGARLMFRELRVGFINGCLLGAVAFAVVGAYICLFKGEPLFYSFAVSGCVSLALIASMAVSSLAGTAIPLMFSRAGVDPAVASGPLITTVNDLVAVVAYYGLAWLLLIHVLHLA